MPLSCLISYYPFYNSPYYVGTFVAPDDQAGYRSYLRSFGDQYADQIDEQAPTAAYVTSGGSRVTGAQAGINSSDISISDDDASDGYGDAGAGLDEGDDSGGDDGDDGGGGDDGGAGASRPLPEPPPPPSQGDQATCRGSHRGSMPQRRCGRACRQRRGCECGV